MNLSLPAVLGRLPFGDTTLFRTSQLDEAHEQIARLVNPHRITVLSDPGRLNIRFNGIRDENISFLHIEYGATVDVKPDGSKEYFSYKLRWKDPVWFYGTSKSIPHRKTIPL